MIDLHVLSSIAHLLRYLDGDTGNASQMPTLSFHDGYTFIPQDLARLTLLPAQNPTYCENPPTLPPTFCTSFNLRSRNS